MTVRKDYSKFPNVDLFLRTVHLYDKKNETLKLGFSLEKVLQVL